MNERPWLLDAFCGAGGATRGYQLAGLRVLGVDKEPQPNYVGDDFVQGDAVEFIAEHGRRFVANAGSPPCQHAAAVTAWRGDRASHVNLIPQTRAAMISAGRPYVIENVPEAGVRRDYLLCGTQFGLPIKRHRAFEIGGWSRPFRLMPPCNCWRNPDLIPFEHKDERAFADALGCPWMTVREGRQAIPPVFTEYLGGQLLAHLATQEMAA